MNFRRDGRLDDQLVFLKRFLEQPLPNAPVDKLVILRLDGEMYGDTGEPLPEALSGGECAVDDDALSTGQLAEQEPASRHRIHEPLTRFFDRGLLATVRHVVGRRRTAERCRMSPVMTNENRFRGEHD